MAVAAWPQSAVTERAIQARQVRWRRVLALVLDLVAFYFVNLAINNVYGVTQVTSGSPIPDEGGAASFASATAVTWPWLVLLWMAYYIVPESLFGASLGKLLTGLCVVRLDGRPVGLGSIVIRNVLRYVDMLPGFYLVGGVVVLLTGSSQRLGDLVAGTTVINRAHALEPYATRHPARSAGRVLGAALVAALLVTIAFDYFGRPALVVEGLYNERNLLQPDLSAYRLGAPQWALGRVTYPLTAYREGQTCTGSISLNWSGFDWEMSDAQLLCKP